MKLTLSWLKDHLETAAPVQAIAEKLSMIGLEVEAVNDPAATFAGFVVGQVIEARRHPNADRLSLCRVETGRGVVEVVCGAPNARTGLKGVYAPVGSTIPGTGLVLKAARIRGVESHGMLLSLRELGLGEDHAGIVELDPGAPVGAPFAEVFGLADPVIEVAVTPNRADCLGVRGIARDLAAAGMGRLKPLAAAPVPARFQSPVRWRLDFPAAAAGACPFIVGRTIRGLRNGPSPGWLKARLEAIGLRPISALVDVTNYFAYDLARPLHVYDVERLAGRELVVRFGRRGERLLALNERTYEADEDMIVIADAAGPQGFGGVIGGEATGCTGATTSVFLEAALFDPVRIAATGRRLGIQSDARYRFERGVDPTSAMAAAEAATRMILDLCGGEASDIVAAGAEPDWRRTIAFRPGRIATLGGAQVPEAEVVGILAALGFEVAGRASGTLSVAVPSWRGDVAGEPDLVEEVLRIWGFDRIATVAVAREGGLPKAALGPMQRRVRSARRVLAGRGLVETVSFSFVGADLAGLFGGVPDTLRLANPIASDLDVMRPSLLPHLLAAVRRNADRGVADVALFEIGPQFAGDRPEDQARVAAGVRAGRTHARHWAQSPRPVDAMDAKADALALLAAAGAPMAAVQVAAEAPPWYHPGKSGVLRLGPKAALAHFGELHPRVLRHLDLAGPAAGFEVFVERIPFPRAGRAAPAPFRPSPYQAVERDFAFVVAREVPAEAVVRAARAAEAMLIVEVGVFDLYEGTGIPAGKKSLALSVKLQATDRTLTEAEIEEAAGRIVAGVETATGGTLRG
ncbi:MAG: phenylalanine--tRNA ligase subunit beta [Proteobacteria bacterium]|nr:phenylalanine--tRNA ligase subunit beta [Pseudomonadota bacterium]